MPTPAELTQPASSESRSNSIDPPVATMEQKTPIQQTATNEPQVGDFFLGIDWDMLVQLDHEAMQLMIADNTTLTKPQNSGEPLVVQFFQGLNSYQPVEQGSGLPMAWGTSSAAVNSVVSTFEQQENDTATASEFKKKRPKRKPAKFSDGFVEEDDYEDEDIYTQSPQDATWNPAQEEVAEPVPKKSTKKKALDAAPVTVRFSTATLKRSFRAPKVKGERGSDRGLTEEDKAEKNRQSARDCRKRKKMYIRTLEAKAEQAAGLELNYQTLQSEHAALKSHAAALELELAGYRRQSAKLKPS